MVPPAVGQAWNADTLYRMFDVGRQNAKRVQSQHQACATAQLRYQERSGASDLAEPGSLNHEASFRHPARHDQKEPIGLREVGQAGYAVERREYPPYRWSGSDGDVGLLCGSGQTSKGTAAMRRPC